MLMSLYLDVNALFFTYLIVEKILIEYKKKLCGGCKAGSFKTTHL